MPKAFYNSTEADLASGALNAVSIVTSVPATYGLTAPIVASYTTLANDFETKLGLATEPATRTSVTISNKNDSKKLLRAASVNLAKIVTATQTVTNAMLLALRMNERLIPTPRPVWPIPPSIDVLSVLGRLANVRVHDAGSERRGLPFGAKSAYLFSYVGPTAPTDATAFKFEGETTRAKAQILFPDSVASGATVWLSACWVSGRGQRSMGSVPISFTLQGGAVPASS
jgi:hypothetical protein